MSLREDALRTAVLKTLADDVTDAIGTAKDGIREPMLDAGIKSLSAKLADGTEVASLTLAGGGAVPRITDPDAFLRWVQANHPGETETVVREGYRKKILDAAKREGRAVDPVSGEVIPGIEFTAGTPYVSVAFAKGHTPGREAIRAAWVAGEIDLRELVALPAPNGNGATA